MTKADRRKEVTTGDNGFGTKFKIYKGQEIWTMHVDCYYFHPLGKNFGKKTNVYGSFDDVLDRIDELKA